MATRTADTNVCGTGSSWAGATFARETTPGREERLMIGVAGVRLLPGRMRKL
jgi:hypothetical protein